MGCQCRHLMLLNSAAWVKEITTPVQEGNYVFTTEGHPIPIHAGRSQRPPPPCAAPRNGSGGGGGGGGGGSIGDEGIRDACETGAASARLRSLRLAQKLARMRALHGVPPATGISWSPLAKDPATCCGPGEIGRSCGAPSPSPALAEHSAGTRKAPGGPGAPTRLVPPDWGFLGAPSALAARLCPHLAAPGGTRVLTACHTRDAENDGACAGDVECGVDAWTCRQRHCSEHHFCVVPGWE